jgi:hypothetical protein
MGVLSKFRFSEIPPGNFPLSLIRKFRTNLGPLFFRTCPMKRGRDTLTGGTMDVNPQWFKVPADNNTQAVVPPGGTRRFVRTVRLPLPINRINQTDKNTATIIEILKCRWSWGLRQTFIGPEVPTSWSIQGFLTTVSPGDPFPNGVAEKGTTLDFFSAENFTQPIITVGDPVVTILPFDQSADVQPITHELHDGAGHGILVATDAIYLSMVTDYFNESLPATGNATYEGSAILCEILYRYKKVALTEFVGIVQSQER